MYIYIYMFTYTYICITYGINKYPSTANFGVRESRRDHTNSGSHFVWVDMLHNNIIAI